MTELLPEAALMPVAARRPLLGEELPIFCERCGYALHGLQAVRCASCAVLQFHCPECGHHQPLNTLRPAATRIIARLRGTCLMLITAGKFVFFGLNLFFWMIMGSVWSVSYNYSGRGYSYRSAEISEGMLMGFGLFAIAFGAVSRMLLLRWRSGVKVGLVLGVLVVLAIWGGIWLESRTRTQIDWNPNTMLIISAYTFTCVLLAASLSWIVWIGLVKALMPTRPGEAMLAWQRSLSMSKPDARSDQPAIILAE